MHDAMSNVSKVYPQLKLKVLVDDTKLHVWWKSGEVLQTVPKVVGKIKKYDARSHVEVIVV